MLSAVISCQFTVKKILPFRFCATGLKKEGSKFKAPICHPAFALRSTIKSPRSKSRAMAEIFRHTHRVTYAECTVGNHIYYARYLNLLEEARGEFVRHMGLSLLALQEQDTIFPAVE